MDYQFPQQLFPSYYNCGPPNRVWKHGAGGWGSYDGVLAQGGTGALSSWTFMPKRCVGGETWRQTEPVPLPLLSPRKAFQGFVTPPQPLDFLTHMQNFFTDHGPDAFGCMSEILGDKFYFRKARRKEKYRQDSANVWTTKRYVDLLKYNICPLTYRSRPLNKYSSLLSDVVHDIPPELLGSLLYEELTEQKDQMQFSERATGGALEFIAFSQSEGCALYPGGVGMDCLYFHKVALENLCERSSCADGGGGGRERASFQLKAPVRQISCSSLFGECCVAVRSDHLCGAWRFGERNEPRLLQVVNTKAAATCVSVSPHILGEVLVASESGAADLWTVGRGMQAVRVEETNLYFSAKSSWRWCEFSAHPRVMLYADRTGADLTDFRLKMGSSPGHTLFRISSTSDCLRGERLLLCRYLGDTHPFHHLLTTQYSVYVMDERFPCVPMLKLDHMMEAPPLFCHVASGQTAGGTTKVLLGSQSSQEITLLQYSGGRVEPCSSRGSPQALLRPTDSLERLPVQLPHRQQTAADRLASPAAGLTCFQRRSGAGERMCVLQLTEAGDVFYQVLERRRLDEGKPGAAGIDPTETGTSGRPAAHSEPPVPDTSSDEDVVVPTQVLVVPETPEKVVSFSEGRSRIHVNDWSQESLTDAGRVWDGKEEVDHNSSREAAPVTLSNASIQTWKRWLLKLMQTCRERKTHQLLSVQTEGLLRLSDEDDGGRREETLKRDLKACMTRRSLLLNGSASVGVPDPVPAPTLVSAEAWTDALSERLTVSWLGEEEWRAWWEEQTGANRKTKAEALRRRRKREKEARRAVGRRLELGGSFTSSVSYQTDLDDLSGWSSAASQGAWSDGEGGAALSKLAAQLAGEEASTLPVAQTQSPLPLPPTTPRRESPIGTRTLPPTQPDAPETPTANRRRSRGQVDDYLSSLCETQQEASQSNMPPLHPSSSSQPTFTSWGSSQRLPPSRASQSQRGASQPSQPKKKKSRMGF